LHPCIQLCAGEECTPSVDRALKVDTSIKQKEELFTQKNNNNRASLSRFIFASVSQNSRRSGNERKFEKILLFLRLKFLLCRQQN